METFLSVLPQSSLKVSDLRTIARSLLCVLKNSFGPKGKQTLIVCQTGQVVTSCDGISILSALHLSHPAAKVMLDSIRGFTEIYGDGCKTLVIYLYEAFTAIEIGFASLDFSDCETLTYKCAVSKCFREFIRDNLPHICLQMEDSNYLTNIKEFGKQQSVFENPVYYLIRSFLSGTIPEQSFEYLTNVIAEFFNSNSIHSHMCLISQWFESFVFVNSSGSYLDSHTSHGLFMRGHFHGQLQSSSHVKFIFLLCPMDGASDDTNCSDIIELTSASVEAVLTYKIQVARKFLQEIRAAGVSLVLTSQSLPDYLLQMCSEFHINILSCLYQSDIDLLMSVTGKLPVISVYSSLSDSNITFGASCEPVEIGGQQFLKIVYASDSESCLPTSIFLHSPTEGFAQQLKMYVRRCVKIVKHYVTGLESSVISRCQERVMNCSSVSIEENSNYGKFYSYVNREVAVQSLVAGCRNLIAGGGYFENVIAHYLQCYSQQDISKQQKFCCSVLVKMLKAVPKGLFDNLCTSPRAVNHSYLCIQKDIDHLLSQQMVCGLNSRGFLCNTLEYNVLEVFSIKVAVLFAAMNLVATLLHVDLIVGVKRLGPGDKELDNRDSASDSDDGE